MSVANVESTRDVKRRYIMSKGLANVVIADTSLSKVDGENGILIYGGYDILDLGCRASFEEVAYLLWHGHLPNKSELADFEADMAAQRQLPPLITDMLQTFPHGAHPMAVLRTAVSALALTDDEPDSLEPAAVRQKALSLTAKTPTIVAAWERIRSGKEVVEPRSDLSHAANFLYMLTGKQPEQSAVNAMDAYLVCLADHGFNASTFATRVTLATISDIYSAVTSGLGTLKGNSHGRANQLAMEQFIEADASGDVAAWYAAKRAAGERIMGVGHRVYKVADPRGKILAPLAKQMARHSGAGRWYEVASQIEALTRADDYFVERELYANVDYYSSIVLYMVGLPLDQFTCAFAMSRMVGWTAHALEQLADNRLIRPKAQYVGPTDLTFVPIENR
jgi:citrate synthase